MIKEARLRLLIGYFLFSFSGTGGDRQTRAAVEEGEEEEGGSHPRGEEANEGTLLSVVPEKGTALPMKHLFHHTCVRYTIL